MFGYFFSNIATASSVPGVQAQTVRLAGFFISAATSTCLVDDEPDDVVSPPPPPPPPPPHAATTVASAAHTIGSRQRTMSPLNRDLTVAPPRCAPRGSPEAPGHPTLPVAARRPHAVFPARGRR